MAEYRQVQCSFWTDAFVLGLTPEEKYFYLYLLTNPKTTQCGAYELPVRVISFETGYNAETVEKLLAKFDSYGKVQYDTATQEVYLVNWLRHNWINSDKVIPRVIKDATKLKSLVIRNHINTVLIGYGYGIDSLAVEEKRIEGEEKTNEKEKTKVISLSAQVFVEGLNQQAWTQWVEYRKQIKKPLKQASIPAAQKALAAFGSDQQGVVEQSIANGWTGLFDLKRPKKAGAPESKLPKAFPKQ